MNIYILIPLISFFLSLSVVILVIAADPKKRLNWIFALYVSTIVWWSFTEFMMRGAVDEATAYFWSKLFLFGTSLMPPLFLTFVLSYTKHRILKKTWVYFAMFVPILILIYLNLTTNMFMSSEMILESWGWNYLPGELFLISMSLSLTYIVIGLYLIYRFYRRTTNKLEKKQSLLFLLGVTFSMMVAALTQGTLPIAIVPLGTFSTAIKVCVYAFAMIKYRLLTIPPVVAMKTIFNSVSELIITINPDKTIAMANPATLNALNYTKEEIITKSAEDIFTDTELFTNDRWEKLLNIGSVKAVRMNLITKDGQKIPISFSGAIVKDKGSVAGVVSISNDTREADKLIDELKQSKADLSLKVDELEKFRKLSVGRELKMIDLKKKLKEIGDKNKT